MCWSPNVCFGFLCQKLDAYFDVWVCFLVFYAIALCVCFGGSNMLFLLLWQCSIIWSPVLWNLQHCFMFRITFVIHCLLCFYMNFRIDFFMMGKWYWKFDGNFIESIDYFWWYSHFHNINSANPSTWELFPHSWKFFSIISP
jgi:hypothetical protein